MAFVKKDKDSSDVKHARVTITSRNPKAAEAMTSMYVSRAADEKVKVTGPVRLPTRTLKITTRKTPCGNGTNTWDTFEMKIYKRTLTIQAPTDTIKKITAFSVEAGVDVGIVILED
ncbi:small subunit ribosomal protein S20e [Strigomonas culicis]|uniref:Small ribosomal subunit protein uS10 n=1 Tax=Strigomonas culicis TaxID=28005 RepID=S9VRG7_9TRYP|nr:small subunit ribosomal protein S20e [Strigomonas culicis]EPY34302.1 small subunit ribosomal protein S20e [Strigomonas culicis]|eukprot:EPY29641.1 small subunit ribosomal protein S20e [Strigomonas culicis]